MKTINTTRIDLNLLVVFEAIYTEGSVTRASSRLNLTQPAISHALARLRTLFDDPLFTRQGHAMVPTAMARSIIEPIATSLSTLDGTLSRASAFDPGKAQRTLAIGLPGGDEAMFLPALLRRVLTASCIDLVVVPSIAGNSNPVWPRGKWTWLWTAPGRTHPTFCASHSPRSA